MNGILQTLQELLQVRDAGFERAQLVLSGTGRRRPLALIRIRKDATELPDPGDQMLTFAHAHRPS